MSAVRPAPWHRTGWKPAPGARSGVALPAPIPEGARGYDVRIGFEGDALVACTRGLPEQPTCRHYVYATSAKQARQLALAEHRERCAVVQPDGDPSTVGAACDAADRARKVAKGE